MVGGQRHAPAALPPGNTRYPLYRRLGGAQDRSGQVRKISPPPWIRFADRPARSESLYGLGYRGSSNKNAKAHSEPNSCYFHSSSDRSAQRRITLALRQIPSGRWQDAKRRTESSVIRNDRAICDDDTAAHSIRGHSWRCRLTCASRQTQQAPLRNRRHCQTLQFTLALSPPVSTGKYFDDVTRCQCVPFRCRKLGAIIHGNWEQNKRIDYLVQSKHVIGLSVCLSVCLSIIFLSLCNGSTVCAKSQ